MIGRKRMEALEQRVAAIEAQLQKQEEFMADILHALRVGNQQATAIYMDLAQTVENTRRALHEAMSMEPYAPKPKVTRH